MVMDCCNIINNVGIVCQSGKKLLTFLFLLEFGTTLSVHNSDKKHAKDQTSDEKPTIQL